LRASHRVVRGAAAAFLVAGAVLADPASNTYQIDPAHDGDIVFSTPFAPPLKALWSVDLGGDVSYPVVSGDMVIVLAGGALGQHIVALNAETGKIAWQKAISGEDNEAYLAIDGRKLFVTNMVGPIQAMDAVTGAMLWAAQPSSHNEYLFYFVPAASAGILYTGAVTSIATYFYAIDEKTGNIVWTQATGGGVGVTLGDGEVFIPTVCDVHAVAPKTGAQIWDHQAACFGGGGSVAAYYDGKLYTPQFYPPGNPPGIVLNAANGKPASGLEGYTPAIHDGTRYWTTAAGGLHATKIEARSPLWTFNPKEKLVNPPIVINGNVYSLSNGGTLYANDGATGKLLQTIRIGLGSQKVEFFQPYTGLGAGQGRLFVPSGSILTALAPKGG
jgi:outer membrane protein assembly factor BamB